MLSLARDLIRRHPPCGSDDRTGERLRAIQAQLAAERAGLLHPLLLARDVQVRGEEKALAHEPAEVRRAVLEFLADLKPSDE